ncbi:MAG: cytochrome c oxidase accessory protein CcoG [Hyphomonas sp.]|uniref:cytochrome c oxidase accessory protein CcoG n=1 Tax=Hyphomonas sp. TaxID=87 RepID=UPI00181C77CD|nr:cytochrome c oxidase accessory protein CcoG [Hyphomonas sp.]MBA3070142.1 cytochrome c oxidase accessory protein CcoG [Hyphomonas sp.]MBU3922336.1 cytochrome c oxidase accessory protein CcoG [Alphaproteobacteria bacterium]MBU4060282.1 cytochrome c oxidase accessory protein CcoG [Alphaproteobacteria bacterium]MBU4162950.1 cytochrome c oxidase accessory protein CcoG [Alphaproteobacteria bacterium]
MTKVTLISSNEGGAPKPERQPSLYERRHQIYPKLAHGKFRTVKWLVMAVTLAAYYLIPWIRWPRGSGIPDQAVLADFEGEKFYFFFLEIWPQEIYFLGALIILAALALFLVTSLFGRVWCGYTCPQTVWTDLYIWVERAFEGDRAARMRLDKAPWSLNKAWRKLGKHAVWLLIAFVTGGAFILYWHDAPTIARTFFKGEAPLTAYFFAGVLTFTTYMLAGTMREQVCTYLCPWPRIQGALTDEHALNVTYRFDRGEPRGPHRKDESWEGRGDCIDCNQCVQVCPMGIDIRDGSQLECIHCALCIDACDDIMRKVGRPTGLIAYDTDKAVSTRASGGKVVYKLIRTRTVLYTILIALISGLILWGYTAKSNYEFNVLKDRSPPYIRLSDGRVRNGYTLKIVNKASEQTSVAVSLEGLKDAEFEIVGVGSAAADGTLELKSEAHGVGRYRMLVTLPENETERRTTLTVRITDLKSGEVASENTPFVMGDR